MADENINIGGNTEIGGQENSSPTQNDGLNNESNVDTNGVNIEKQEQSSQDATPQAIKVRFNHQDMEIGLNDAPSYIQKGLNYDNVYSKYQELANDPRLSFVEELAKSYNMSPGEYIQAVKEQQRQSELDNLIQQNIPEEYAREMLENKRFRQTYEAQLRENEARQKQNQEYSEFLSVYPDINPDAIPGQVWEMVNNGKNILDAYTRYENQILRSEIEALKANNANNSTSNQSMSGNSDQGNVYFSREQVLAMSREEVDKNLDVILASQKQWK